MVSRSSLGWDSSASRERCKESQRRTNPQRDSTAGGASMDDDLSEFSMTFASRPQSRDERVAVCLVFIVGLACITLPFFLSQKFASGVGTEMIVVGLVFCLLSAGLHTSLRYQSRGMWRI